MTNRANSVIKCEQGHIPTRPSPTSLLDCSSLSPLGGGGRRLTLTNVTLLVPSDEFSWWRWWFSRTSNTTSTSTAVGPGWVTGSLMDSSWAAPTVSDTNLHWAHAQGHQRSWAWSDVVIADRAGPEPPPSAFPPVWPLSGLSLITGYAAAQAVSAGDLVPLTLYSLLIQLDPTDLRTGPAPAAPTLTPDVLHNFLYVWSAALDPQEFAATPPSMARSSALMGQPVRPRTTVLDLAGCPPSVNILPGAVFSLMHLVLAGAPPSPRAAVCGAAARAAGIVTSAPWPAGCPAAEDGVRLSAWRALGLPDVSGPGFVNGTQVGPWIVIVIVIVCALAALGAASSSSGFTILYSRPHSSRPDVWARCEFCHGMSGFWKLGRQAM